MDSQACECFPLNALKTLKAAHSDETKATNTFEVACRVVSGSCKQHFPNGPVERVGCRVLFKQYGARGLD